jgi:hypothetical protein
MFFLHDTDAEMFRAATAHTECIPREAKANESVNYNAFNCTNPVRVGRKFSKSLDRNIGGNDLLQDSWFRGS